MTDIIRNNEFNTSELTDFKIEKNCENDMYYICARYKVEDDNKVDELILKYGPLNLLNFPDITQSITTDVPASHCVWYREDWIIDFGFGKIDGKIDSVEVNTLEYKTKDMTIEEIEKKLGHKVRIVNKE